MGRESKKLCLKCLRCGTDFTCYPSQPLKYCSRDCYEQTRQQDKKTATACPTCGKLFSYLKSWPRKYCSKTCSGKAAISHIPGFTATAYDAACEQCGRTFRTTPAAARGRFCSHTCYGQWLSANIVGEAHPTKGRKMGRPKALPPPLTQVCQVCGSHYETKPSQAGQRKTCSKQCAGKAGVIRMNAIRAERRPPRPQLYCAVCGKEVQRDPNRAAPPNFCSKKCMGKHFSKTRIGENHPNWRGGRADFYGTSWPAASRAARKRDKVCQECGCERTKSGRNLSVHHVVPFKSFGAERHREANVLSNLVTLCNPCHMRREWAEGALATTPNPRNKGQKRAPRAPS